MTPSKEGLDAIRKRMGPISYTLLTAIEDAYAIDVAPLEARVKELEAENQALKQKLEHSQPEVDFDEWQK